MDAQKVDMFLMTNAGNFPAEKVPFIREKLLAADDQKWGMIATTDFKKPVTALIISLLIGTYGIDRFYLGQTKLGIIKLITCGGACIWTIVDWFLIMGVARDLNYQKIANIIQ